LRDIGIFKGVRIMNIPNGEIIVKDLIEILTNKYKPEDKLILMCEDSETGVGYNVSIVDFGEIAVDEDTDEINAKIYFTF
jgi:hypothetical protein